MDEDEAKGLEQSIFNERRLYQALGKEDARTVLHFWKEYKGQTRLGVSEAIRNAAWAAKGAAARRFTNSSDVTSPVEEDRTKRKQYVLLEDLGRILDALYGLALEVER